MVVKENGTTFDQCTAKHVLRKLALYVGGESEILKDALATDKSMKAEEVP